MTVLGRIDSGGTILYIAPFGTRAYLYKCHCTLPLEVMKGAKLALFESSDQFLVSYKEQNIIQLAANDLTLTDRCPIEPPVPAKA